MQKLIRILATRIRNLVQATIWRIRKNCSIARLSRSAPYQDLQISELKNRSDSNVPILKGRLSFNFCAQLGPLAVKGSRKDPIRLMKYRRTLLTGKTQLHPNDTEVQSPNPLAIYVVRFTSTIFFLSLFFSYLICPLPTHCPIGIY